MTNLKKSASVNVGIDVGKSQLDIFIFERDRHFTVENNTSGIREAIRLKCEPRNSTE